MKKLLPVLFLLLLILADAFVKNYAVERFPDVSLTPFLILLACCVVYFYVYFRNFPGEWESFDADVALSRRGFRFLVISLILIGGLLRFWKLGSLYEGLFLDEAYNGLDAIAIRELGARPLFLAWNSGREALVAYLDALSTVFFGYGAFAIRAVTAAAGTLTLLFFYLLVRRLFPETVAVLALFLLTFSKYAILYNRFGLRFNLMLLFEVAALYYLARAMLSENKAYGSFLLAGLCAGIGFHTYIPYRIFPLVYLAFLLDAGVRNRIKRHLPGLLAAALVCAAVVSPLVWYYIEHPRAFSGRMEKTAIWSKQKQPLPVLVAKSARDTAAIFTYRSDANPRHNVREEPGLSPFVTAFCILGFVLVLSKFSARYSKFLIMYTAVTLVPGILATDAPHASRVLGALPPAVLFTSLGIIAAIRIVSLLSRTTAKMLTLVVLVGAMITGPVDSLFRYSAQMDAQPPSTTALWGMDSVETSVARYMNRFHPEYRLFLSTQLYLHATVQYLTYGRSEHSLYNDQTELPPGQISLVILQLTTRNMWWLRDDDDKNFYHWWSANYGLEPAFLRSQVRRYYVNYPRTTRYSDIQVLQSLQKRYPAGRLVHFDQFSVYLVKP